MNRNHAKCADQQEPAGDAIDDGQIIFILLIVMKLPARILF
jgi:hypothetical protein